MKFKDECELCRLEHKTKWHYADVVLVVCDCLTCGMPMLVFRRHGKPTDQECLYAQQLLRERYGARLINIRTQARLIKDHEHWHLYLKETEKAKNDN